MAVNYACSKCGCDVTINDMLTGSGFWKKLKFNHTCLCNTIIRSPAFLLVWANVFRVYKLLLGPVLLLGLIFMWRRYNLVGFEPSILFVPPVAIMLAFLPAFLIGAPWGYALAFKNQARFSGVDLGVAFLVLLLGIGVGMLCFEVLSRT